MHLNGLRGWREDLSHSEGLVFICDVCTEHAGRPALWQSLPESRVPDIRIYRLQKAISFITDRQHNRDNHTLHPHDQQDKRPDRRLIVSAAGATVWLPHSKRRNTRLKNKQGT